MRGVASVMIALTVVVMVSGTCAAQADSPGDFVTGGGLQGSPPGAFSISANSGPLGENPKGTLSFKVGTAPITNADVTCLIVNGNEAIATGKIDFGESEPGQLVVMDAVDNGDTVAPDLLRFSFVPFIVPDPSRPGCFLPILSPVPIVQGNINVHDADATP